MCVAQDLVPRPYLQALFAHTVARCQRRRRSRAYLASTALIQVQAWGTGGAPFACLYGAVCHPPPVEHHAPAAPACLNRPADPAASRAHCPPFFFAGARRHSRPCEQAGPGAIELKMIQGLTHPQAALARFCGGVIQKLCAASPSPLSARRAAPRGAPLWPAADCRGGPAWIWPLCLSPEPQTREEAAALVWCTVQR